MISKSKYKWVKSLQLKKYRQEEQCFIVQGWKSVESLLKSSFEIVWIAAVGDFADRITSYLDKKNPEFQIVSEEILKELGSFQSNDSVLAVARMKPLLKPVWDGSIILALDDIRDPGNLGSIIRTADWFGLKHIIASETTVDFYNPKVIAATMGSFCSINFFSTPLPDFLKEFKGPIWGAFLKGKDVNNFNFSEGGMIVIGNESNGISDEVTNLVSHRITIPGKGGAESLNASVALGIILNCAVQGIKKN